MAFNTSYSSLTSSATGNSSADLSRPPPSLYSIVPVSICLAIFIISALLGNLFVIIAFCLKKKLRKPTNYFIVNLAAADLTLAVMILPMSAAYDVTGNWMFGAELCLIWSATDILVSTASILNLVAISADRYLAIRSVRKQTFALSLYQGISW